MANSVHGMAKARGCGHARLGSFGVMFPNLRSWAVELGIDRHEAEEIARRLGSRGGLMDGGAEANRCKSAVPAAYTFFAQFVDHDVTLDITTSLSEDDRRYPPKSKCGHCPGGDEGTDSVASKAHNANIEALPNLRSASLDLDCVYGLGPEAMPFMFGNDGTGVMLTGTEENSNDLNRNRDGRALIGDPRNDENIFVSQLQLLFIRLHNRLLAGRSFEEAQTQARFHYQKIVLDDFLRRVGHPATYDFFRDQIDKRANAIDQYHPSKDKLFNLVDACGRVFMPVEFSVAAYRFGHVTVRSNYPTNAANPVIELFDERFGTLGFGGVPAALTVDWRFLLDVSPEVAPVTTKAFDHLLVDEMISLPDPVVGKRASDDERSLAFRNLQRGYVMGLPSGQTVAKELERLGVPGQVHDLELERIDGWCQLSAPLRAQLARHTPLFFYLMREAGVVGGAETLGPVATSILMRTFGTMLLACKESFLRPRTIERCGACGDEDRARWSPLPEIARGDGLTLADVVRFVEAAG